ncbi:DEAD/DEAH box helicase [Nocardioides pelophilus]|uniref:DEAD/DEAH box helicase n=1 Tax=Nocardioides pelophilus TaxID=2172019 RepID=UPI00160285C2|nr:DEAD/DEAH box helicase [Nocardioides pelophilus]
MTNEFHRFARTGKTLRAWQEEALRAWEKSGRVGVVQAVTGTGKTQVGIEAACGELAQGGKVVVVVPTTTLLNQWRGQLSKGLPSAHVGLLGDGNFASFDHHDVVVSTIQSLERLAPVRRGLLVADECHRYGAEKWMTSLRTVYTGRLGLSATYERGDDGDSRLAAYFGRAPVYDIAYDRAISDGIVAPFKLAFVGVALTRQEQEDYDEASSRSGKARRALVEDFGLRKEPFAEFMKDVTLAADGKWRTNPGEAHAQAIKFLHNFTKTRKIVAETQTKWQLLESLRPLVGDAGGTLVFTQTKQAARNAASAFSDVGRGAAFIISGMKSDEREEILTAFRDGHKSVIAAPRVLDEGVDVPDADLGIVLSASSSRRQMIQRMGRVLRVKANGSHARLLILYAEGTMEDPARGAHESFVEIAWDVAAASEIFGSRRSISDIMTFLAS